MDGSEAEVADHNLVLLVIVVVEADIAHDIVVVFVLVNPDLLVRVLRVNLIALSLLTCAVIVDLFIDLHGRGRL